MTGEGPVAVISDPGILQPDDVAKELTLTDLHPGVTSEQVQAATGWNQKTTDPLHLNRQHLYEPRP